MLFMFRICLRHTVLSVPCNLVGKPNFSDQFKKIIKRMPRCKPNHGL